MISFIYKTFIFGGAVKKYAKEIFNMQGKDRSLLINFANKMREIDKDVWIRPVIEESRLFENCIVDDVRYQNELDALVNDNWIIIILNISRELQEERIRETYPENYELIIGKIEIIYQKKMNLILRVDIPT